MGTRVENNPIHMDERPRFTQVTPCDRASVQHAQSLKLGGAIPLKPHDGRPRS
ncbi:hypothetical protein PV328_002584, partial [Microctonus aethiopoides]